MADANGMSDIEIMATPQTNISTPKKVTVLVAKQIQKLRGRGSSDSEIVHRFIVYRNTWLGNSKLLIIDLIVNIILDYLKKTVNNLFIITTNISEGVL